MKHLLTIFILLFLAFHAPAQQGTTYYVQFKVSSVADLESAELIDKKMSTKKGILSTRTDHITSTFFCTMSGDMTYAFEDFESWFKKMGYEISCFNKGIQGDGGMVSPHELKNCEESNSNN